MSCAVRSCRNEMYRRPDLTFFNIPRQPTIKEEWLEVLGIEPGDQTVNIKVCELHFKEKDFGSIKKNQKTLKVHAVPVINLGTRKSEPIDSDDEFMEEEDVEIIEVPSKPATPKAIKTEPKDVKPSPAKESDNEESGEGRRPSRRAAREAAKKIYNTVRSYMPKSETASPPGTPTPTLPNPYRQKRNRNSVKITPVIVDLIMECHEEILSPAQAEALLKAQLEYNMVMKTLRALKASNVKIICSKEPYPTVSQIPSNNGVSVETPQNSQKPSVVPMTLSSNTSLVVQKLAVA